MFPGYNFEYSGQNFHKRWMCTLAPMSSFKKRVLDLSHTVKKLNMYCSKVNIIEQISSINPQPLKYCISLLFWSEKKQNGVRFNKTRVDQCFKRIYMTFMTFLRNLAFFSVKFITVGVVSLDRFLF